MQVRLGVGVVAGVAAQALEEALGAVPCGHLCTPTARLAVEQGACLRGFVYAFIELLAPGWSRRRLE